jgi:hypothetical protein
MKLIEIGTQKCLMMPYYEDQSEIVAEIDKLKEDHGGRWLKQVLFWDTIPLLLIFPWIHNEMIGCWIWTSWIGWSIKIFFSITSLCRTNWSSIFFWIEENVLWTFPSTSNSW